MTQTKRVFILGAGFSKPAGMPLATGLIELILQKLESQELQDNEMQEWLDGMQERLEWLSGGGQRPRPLNIEEVFHYANFDVEVFRLKQQGSPVGRYDGPGTPWNVAESITTWLGYLEDALRDVIFENEDRADFAPIKRWAKIVDAADSVVTFNYDTLVERALKEIGKTWNHGMGHEADNGVPVFKLHGSIDWIVADRSENFHKLDLLFDKPNKNRTKQNTGHIEDDACLWRCRTREQQRNWISGRDLQSGSWKSVGIAGLGAYKQLHQIPGLGHVWSHGMRALHEADVGIVVGFSMSDFDAMAQMQFAEVARKRWAESRPLPVIVIDPFASEATKERFRRVFRTVDFVSTRHENLDWACLLTEAVQDKQFTKKNSVGARRSVKEILDDIARNPFKADPEGPSVVDMLREDRNR